MTEKWRCPRRPADDPKNDQWRKGRGLGPVADELSCTYCGSLNPDKFMYLVRAGWQIGPTDKYYKVYIGHGLTEAQKTQRKAAWEREWRPVAFTAATETTEKPTPSEVRACLDRLWEHHGRQIAWGTAPLEYKFYWYHLNQKQQSEFIELYNARAINVGYPGYLYTAPYFCDPRERHDPQRSDAEVGESRRGNCGTTG